MLSAVFLNLFCPISNSNLALTHLSYPNSSKIQYIFVISPSLFWSLMFSPWTFSKETSLLPLTLAAKLHPFSLLASHQISQCLQLDLWAVSWRAAGTMSSESYSLMMWSALLWFLVNPSWQVHLANAPAHTAVIIIESTKLDLVFQVHISALVTAVFCYLSIFNLQTTVHIIFPVAFEMCGRVCVFKSEV